MASSPIERHLVPVSRPTALEGQTFLPVPGQDLVNLYVRNVHVIPGQVDVERFEAALSKNLSRYPHMAGRFARIGDDWQINLTNDPVPVIIASSTETAHPFPDNFVLQPTHMTNDLANMDDANKLVLRGEGNECLLVIKLTISPTWTAIAIAFCHVLGDAQAYLDFTVSLSRYYEDLNTSEDQLPLAPDFYRHVYPPPWGNLPVSAENMLPRMPHLAQDYDMAGMYKLYGSDLSTTEEIQFRLSSQTITKIHQSAKIGNDGTFISVQDAISAYITTALSQTFDKPITKVINIVNYRWPVKLIASAPKFAHPAAAANCIYATHSERIPPDQIHSVPYIAKIIRDSIQLARQPDFIQKWWSFGSWLMARAANTDRFHYFPPHDEWQAIQVNSNYRFDWNQAHFGRPGKASFHTSWSSRNVVRIFDCNIPSAGAPSGPKPADISFLIKKEKKPILTEIILRDFPDTVFQETTTPPLAKSDLEIAKARD